MTAREVARRGPTVIDAARLRLTAGDVLLLFGEGSRSRTAALLPPRHQGVFAATLPE